MNGFGRIIDTTVLPAGGLMNLEDQGPFTAFPQINNNNAVLVNALPKFMNDNPLEPEYAPTLSIYTQLATGGCVPICAAEITPAQGTTPRTVNWTYLIHATGTNLPKNVSVWADDPNNVYVCMMVHSGAVGSIHTAPSTLTVFFDKLDPTGAIPNANALMIFGPQSSLVITPAGQIAVLG